MQTASWAKHSSGLLLRLVTGFWLALVPSGLRAGEWQNISADVYKKLQDEAKPQGDIKHSGGIAVEPVSGDVYLMMCGQGIWKSSDQGASFTRIDDGSFDGRCETGGSFNVDPKGGRMVLATVYGSSALISNGGKSIRRFTSGHFDYIAVDWPGEAKTMLTFRHESGETLTLTSDGGQTWTDLGKGFKGYCVGVFDATTLIASRGQGLLRSTDRGSTWKQVSDREATSPVVVNRDGKGYLLSRNGLLVTKDQGATWNIQGSPMDGAVGPVFGKTAAHMLVVGNEGVMETTDDGETWTKIAPQPPDYPRIGNLGRTVTPTLAFDSERNILYMSRLGYPAYKLKRSSSE